MRASIISLPPAPCLHKRYSLFFHYWIPQDWQRNNNSTVHFRKASRIHTNKEWHKNCIRIISLVKSRSQNQKHPKITPKNLHHTFHLNPQNLIIPRTKIQPREDALTFAWLLYPHQSGSVPCYCQPRHDCPSNQHLLDHLSLLQDYYHY